MLEPLVDRTAFEGRGHQFLQRTYHRYAVALGLRHMPRLEPGAAVDREAIEEVTAVQRDGVLMAPPTKQHLERPRIRPCTYDGERFSVRFEMVRSDTSKSVYGSAEVGAGDGARALGPQQVGEHVPRHRSVGVRQVDQQSFSRASLQRRHALAPEDEDEAAEGTDLQRVHGFPVATLPQRSRHGPPLALHLRAASGAADRPKGARP
jgi:hypothetical protein